MMATKEDERHGAIALNSVPYLYPQVFWRLHNHFGSVGNILSAGETDLGAVKEVSAKMAQSIRGLDVEKAARRQIELAEQLGAIIITVIDEDYPDRLKTIFAPPPVLSLQGELTKADELSIAVVGMRKSTGYGRLMTERCAGELAESGITIVSGLARGIDGVAHRSAISAGGRTIAVLGNGLNVYYPPEHRKLQKEITQKGAVISQFPITASPDKRSFPLRNRTVVGLCAGVVVIEAAQKSGALITAYCALEENREVFAYPGQVNLKSSLGTNRLIQKGHAKLVLETKDILDELPSAFAEAGQKETKKRADDTSQLSIEEKLVLETMDEGMVHIDAISSAAGLPSNIVSAILLALELGGRVKQEPGAMYLRL